MNKLVRFYDIGALVCFSAMMGCVMIEVVARNIIHLPTTWAEELSRFMCVWTVFLGSASAWFRSTHIVVNVLPRRLKGFSKKSILALAQILSLIFLLCVWAGSILIMIAQKESKTTALEISISWFYLALFLGSTGMLVFHLDQMIKTFKTASTNFLEG